MIKAILKWKVYSFKDLEMLSVRSYRAPGVGVTNSKFCYVWKDGTI